MNPNKKKNEFTEFVFIVIWLSHNRNNFGTQRGTVENIISPYKYLSSSTDRQWSGFEWNKEKLESKQIQHTDTYFFSSSAERKRTCTCAANKFKTLSNYLTFVCPVWLAATHPENQQQRANTSTRKKYIIATYIYI